MDWEAWKFLLGEWEGGNAGDPGQGSGTFSFSFDLDENILVRRSRMVFPPTKEREGYTHEDLVIIYTEFTGQKRPFISIMNSTSSITKPGFLQARKPSHWKVTRFHLCPSSGSHISEPGMTP